MAERIPQSVAKRVVFRAYLSSDHVSPATGKTIAVTISKNGGSFANPAAGATNATEISSGFYYFDLGTGDSGTLGPLAYRGAVATIDDVGDVFEVVKATNAGFSALPDVAAEGAGGLFTRGTGAGQIKQDANGRIDVNVRALLDTAWLAPGTAGTPDMNAKLIGGTAQTGLDLGANWTAARAAHLDADISSRMATYTQPSGFLTASFPSAVGDATAANQSTINTNVLSRLAASSYTAPDNTSIAAIKVQTDKMTFTVPGYLDANIRYVNSVAINGAGTSGSPFGP